METIRPITIRRLNRPLSQSGQGYGRTMRPGSIPYRWFWVLGGVLIVVCVAMIVQGAFLAAAGVGCGAAGMILLDSLNDAAVLPALEATEPVAIGRSDLRNSGKSPIRRSLAFLAG
jgi:hypothetical protein